MAKNFHVNKYRKNNGFHLKLKGDFDGTSAYDLIHILTNKKICNSKIFIHLETLKSVEPFGLDVLQKNLPSYCRKNLKFIYQKKMTKTGGF